MRCKAPAKEGGKHLHAHDKAFHKGKACFFEQGPCSAHMVLINSSAPALGRFAELLVLNRDFMIPNLLSYQLCWLFVVNYERTVGGGGLCLHLSTKMLLIYCWNKLLVQLWGHLSYTAFVQNYEA